MQRLLKVKYLIKVQSKRQIKIQNIFEIEKNVTDHNDDKYITTPELYKFTAEIFAA